MLADHVARRRRSASRRRSRGSVGRCTVERALALVSTSSVCSRALARIVGGKPREAVGRVPVRVRSRCAEDPEPAPGHGAQEVVAVGVAVEVVLAVAEEREVLVGQPLQERPAFGELVGVDRRRSRLRARRRPRRPRRASSASRRSRRARRRARARGRRARRRGCRRDVSRSTSMCSHDSRTTPGVGRSPPSVAERASPSSVRVTAEDRVHDEVDAEVVTVERHRDRVDEERHVVVDDVDHRVRRVPALGRDGRRVHPHDRVRRRAGARRAASARARRARGDRRRQSGEVVDRAAARSTRATNASTVGPGRSPASSAARWATTARTSSRASTARRHAADHTVSSARLGLPYAPRRGHRRAPGPRTRARRRGRRRSRWRGSGPTI